MTSMWRVIHADVLDGLRQLEDGSVQTCVTSPPYWGLRDYGVTGQMGLEPTLGEWLGKMVQVFEEVRRVLRPDGTLWLNLGDCHATGAGSVGEHPGGGKQGERWRGNHLNDGGIGPMTQPNRMPQDGLKPKDLAGMPWRAAFALQAAGWYLRSDIIWHKPNPMPESVTDRPTRAHEYIFLMAKSARYFYDAEAIAEPVTASTIERISQPTFDEQKGGPKDPGTGNRSHRRALVNLAARNRTPAGWHQGTRPAVPSGLRDHANGYAKPKDMPERMKRNRRTVWTIPTQPYAEAHFATFPQALVGPCILAGCPRGGLVLDPFAGSGTVGMVARNLGRRFVGVELNAEYCKMAERRIGNATPLFDAAGVF